MLIPPERHVPSFLRTNCRSPPPQTICLCQISASNYCSDVSFKHRWLTLRRNFPPNPDKLLEPTTEDLLSLSGSILRFAVCLFLLANVDNLLLHPGFSVWKRKSKASTVNVRFPDRSSEKGLPQRAAILYRRSARQGEGEHRAPFLHPREQETDQNAVQLQDRLWFDKSRSRTFFPQLGNLRAAFIVFSSCS